MKRTASAILIAAVFLLGSCKDLVDSTLASLIAKYIVAVPTGLNDEATIKASAEAYRTDFSLPLTKNMPTKLSDGSTKIYTVVGIMDNGFESCKVTSITKGIIESVIKTIGKKAFLKCSELETINLTNLTILDSIGDSAFESCTRLISVDLPDSEKQYTLGKNVFKSSGVKTIIVRDPTPPTIDVETFSSCKWLTAIYVPDDKVDTYKTAVAWKEAVYWGAIHKIINIIKPISAIPTP